MECVQCSGGKWREFERRAILQPPHNISIAQIHEQAGRLWTRSSLDRQRELPRRASGTVTAMTNRSVQQPTRMSSPMDGIHRDESMRSRAGIIAIRIRARPLSHHCHLTASLFDSVRDRGMDCCYGSKKCWSPQLERGFLRHGIHSGGIRRRWRSRRSNTRRRCGLTSALVQQKNSGCGNSDPTTKRRGQTGAPNERHSHVTHTNTQEDAVMHSGRDSWRFLRPEADSIGGRVFQPQQAGAVQRGGDRGSASRTMESVQRRRLKATRHWNRQPTAVTDSFEGEGERQKRKHTTTIRIDRQLSEQHGGMEFIHCSVRLHPVLECCSKTIHFTHSCFSLIGCWSDILRHGRHQISFSSYFHHNICPFHSDSALRRRRRRISRSDILLLPFSSCRVFLLPVAF